MTTRKVWAVRAGEQGEAHDLFIGKSVIALRRDNMDDLSSCIDRDDFKAEWEKANPGDKGLAIQAGQYYRFIKVMNIGDIVVYPSKVQADKTIYIGEVTGEYRYAPDIDREYSYQRDVEWLTSLPRDALSSQVISKLRPPMTIFRIHQYTDVFLSAIDEKANPL